MAQQIYGSSLLNDIHNWFPDILYNPQRFRTIQDFLEYIRQVAATSPYTQGYQQYIARQHRRPTVDPFASAATAASAASAATASYRPSRSLHPDRYIASLLESALHGASPGIATETTYEYTTYMGGASGASGANVPITARVRTLPIHETGELEPVMEQALSQFLTQFTSSDLFMRNFLEQSVVVAPTREELDRASTLEQCSSTSEDICSICQDTFKTDQPIRRLNYCDHSFHKTCVDTWFQTNVKCPMCRHDIRNIHRAPPPPVPDNHRITNIHDRYEE